MAAKRLAVEHVRRMRGGAQTQLMRCDDEAYYIVKFQNNAQHLRILANEMLATRLAARLRRLHPAADEELLLRLPAEFDRQFAGREMQAGAILEKFDETLSNAVQHAPRNGLLARDPDAELERLFREQVEPLREARRVPAEIRTRSDLRARAADFFRSEKILRLMQRGVRVKEFTAPAIPCASIFLTAATVRAASYTPWPSAAIRARPNSSPTPRAQSASASAIRRSSPSPNASPRRATCVTSLLPGFSTRAIFAWSRSPSCASGRMTWRRCCARKGRDPRTVTRGP